MANRSGAGYTVFMETLEYRFQKGARLALNITGILCILLIIGIPIAIWIFVRVAGAKVILSAQGVTAKGLGTTQYAYGEVARLGVCRIPVPAKGIAGMLARQRVGGSEAIRVQIIDTKGKKKGFIVSSYERADEIMAKISERTGKSYEIVTVGAFGMKWPETPAAS